MFFAIASRHGGAYDCGPITTTHYASIIGTVDAAEEGERSCEKYDTDTRASKGACASYVPSGRDKAYSNVC